MLINLMPMNALLNLTPEEAQRLRRLLHDFRASLAVSPGSLSWRNFGEPIPQFSIEDIIFLEDLRCQLATFLEDEASRVHFAGCCNIY